MKMDPFLIKSLLNTANNVVNKAADSHEKKLDREKELVFVFKTIYDGDIRPSEELDEGRFWTKAEIAEHFGKDVFTPNFEHEYKRMGF